jgi:hypothetical protein
MHPYLQSFLPQAAAQQPLATLSVICDRSILLRLHLRLQEPFYSLSYSGSALIIIVIGWTQTQLVYTGRWAAALGRLAGVDDLSILRAAALAWQPAHTSGWPLARGGGSQEAVWCGRHAMMCILLDATRLPAALRRQSPFCVHCYLLPRSWPCALCILDQRPAQYD